MFEDLEVGKLEPGDRRPLPVGDLHVDVHDFDVDGLLDDSSGGLGLLLGCRRRCRDQKQRQGKESEAGSCAESHDSSNPS